MAESIKCETCGELADLRCVWGLYDEPTGIPRTTPMQEADLCSTCSDALWHKIKGAVNMLNMHFAITKHYKLDRIKTEALNNLYGKVPA